MTKPFKVDPTDREFAQHAYSKRMTQLCRSLSVLRYKIEDPANGLDPWNPLRLEASMGPWSSGERNAAQFVLQLWNGNYPGVKFDLFDAMSTLGYNEFQDMINFLNEWNRNRWWP